MNVYRSLADVVVLFHAAYIAFVVFGLIAVVVGLARRKAWARNFWLRIVHLAMIGVVVVQAWAGVVCPLTTLENRLRRAGGQEPYPLDFIEFWLHKVVFVRADPLAFLACYSVFGLLVVATFVFGPPRRPGQ